MKKYLLILSLAAIALFLNILNIKPNTEKIKIGNKQTNNINIASFEKNQKPKNIILIIGDGTGLNQVTLSRIAIGGLDFKLAIDQMPYTGFSLTHSYNNAYTDSAAAATSWATGKKTNNKFLSVDVNKKKLKTLPEILYEKGFLSGLVSTSSITHATPAAFYAHIDSRYKEEEIANQLIASSISIALGGGKEFFDNERLKKNSLYISDKESLEELDLSVSRRVIGLFDKDGIERSPEKPTQQEMTSVALNFLKTRTNNCKGFFLMSEGSQIDWAAHDNDAKKMITEFEDFDKTIRLAMEYVGKNKDTLLIITADHETGGLQILKQDKDYVEIQWGTGRHTGIPVGVYAYGPGASHFTGLMDNTEIYHKIISILSVDELESVACI
ncbi:alkaline phosphatase [Gammaproteobacteria bacterium]|nr:alkaline phosphatase [Gammaproteobacteria bacterium]